MLSGNLIAGYQQEVYNTSEYNEDAASVRATITDTEADIKVGVYAYKDRIIVQMLTSGGTIEELVWVHPREKRVILNHDAGGTYQ